VLEVAEDLLSGVRRLFEADTNRWFVVAKLVGLAARDERQRQSEWERKHVHRRSFQLWP
jgi:hypothetical protein